VKDLKPLLRSFVASTAFEPGAPQDDTVEKLPRREAYPKAPPKELFTITSENLLFKIVALVITICL
jgi:hypothetical protein